MQEPHKSTSTLSPPARTSLNTRSLEDLPQDVLALIIFSLPQRFILSLSLVCKTWKKITNEDWLWKRIFFKRWPLFNSYPLPSSQPISPHANKPKSKAQEKKNTYEEGEWKKNYKEHNSNLPIVICATVTKTMAGFAGENLPRFFKASTIIDINDSHCNIVGRGWRVQVNKRDAFSEHAQQLIGVLGETTNTSGRSFICNLQNQPVEPIDNFAKYWTGVFVQLGITHPGILFLLRL